MPRLFFFLSLFAVLSLERLGLLLLLDLEEERAVDVWQHTTESNSGANQGVELLVTTDGELQVARGDTLDLQVLGGVLRRVSRGLGRRRDESTRERGKDCHLRLQARGLRQSGTQARR